MRPLHRSTCSFSFVHLSGCSRHRSILSRSSSRRSLRSGTSAVQPPLWQRRCCFCCRWWSCCSSRMMSFQNWHSGLCRSWRWCRCGSLSLWSGISKNTAPVPWLWPRIQPGCGSCSWHRRRWRRKGRSRCMGCPGPILSGSAGRRRRLSLRWLRRCSRYRPATAGSSALCPRREVPSRHPSLRNRCASTIGCFPACRRCRSGFRSNSPAPAGNACRQRR